LPDVSYKRLFALNSKEWPYLVVGCIAAGINGAVQPVFSILFSEMVALFYKPPDGKFSRQKKF
jgi:hypothetical protein